MTTTPQHYDEVLPDPGFEITPGATAVVITDPQVDFLIEDGVTWGIVGPSVETNDLSLQLDGTSGRPAHRR